MYENFQKKHNYFREPSTNCSHICYVDVSKLVYESDPQSVKDWRMYNFPDMNSCQLCMKSLKKHNKSRSFLIECGIYRYIKMSTLISIHTFCEGLEVQEMQHIKHESSSI